MPNMTNIVSKHNDGPDRVFKPRGNANGVATYVDNTSGVPLGDSLLTISQTKNATSGKTKSVFKLVTPTVGTAVVNGVSKPAVVRTNYMELTLTVDASSTKAERDEVLAALYYLILEPTFRAVAVDLEGIY